MTPTLSKPPLGSDAFDQFAPAGSPLPSPMLIERYFTVILSPLATLEKYSFPQATVANNDPAFSSDVSSFQSVFNKIPMDHPPDDVLVLDLRWNDGRAVVPARTSRHSVLPTLQVVNGKRRRLQGIHIR